MTTNKFFTSSKLVRNGELSVNKLAFFLNLPSAFIILLVIAYPIVYAVYLSLHEITISGLRSGDTPFVGLKNYFTILTDPLFLSTLIRTIIIAIVSVSLQVSLGLFVALAMNCKKVWISYVTRTLVILPWAVPPVANGLMWSFIYNSKFGHLNASLLGLGIIDDYISILSDPTLAVIGVIWAYVWRVLPFEAILFYAALQTIPKDLYEAATVDGASAWKQFCQITLPLLRPVLAVILILRTAFAIMIFDEVFALTHGGPGDSTWTAAWYSYWTSFKLMEFDTGAASSFVLAVVIAIFTLLYIKFVYIKIEY